MTYEDLIVAIDDAAPKLSEASLRLLLRLVSLAIQTGSGTLHLSHSKLAEMAGMSREGVARATRGLESLITIERNQTVLTKFILPANWFPPQPTLFQVSTSQPSWQTGQLPRPVLANEVGKLANFPGQSTCQPSWQTSQLPRPVLANQVGKLANEPGQISQQSWQAGTENEQLSGDSLIRSDQNPDLDQSSSISQISQISTVRKLCQEQRHIATLLSKDLAQYMALHHPPGGCEASVPEIVLARCLFIAGYETLAETLRNLHSEGRTCGRRYAWFVTVFLQRIHGVDPELLATVLEQGRLAKKVKATDEPLFAETLVSEVAAGVRRMA